MTDSEGLPWLGLVDGETICWTGQPRLTTIWPWVGLSVLGLSAIAVAVILQTVSLLWLLLVPLTPLPAVGAFLSIRKRAYVLTTERIAIHSGIIGRHVKIVPLDRIQNSALSQHALGQAGDYGTISLETADGDRGVRFQNINNPQEALATIDQQRTHTATGESVPGTHEAWLTVRNEVRALRNALEP